MVRELDRSVSADKEFSIRDRFVDAWYHLHNAADDRELVLSFKTTEEDFPQNVDELRIQHVLLYFAKSKGGAGAVEVKHLRLVYADGEKERP